MRKFKKGDRVRGVAGRGGLGISKIVGLEGTIINYPSDTSIICVEFDKPFDGGHDGNGYGRGKDNHCFNLNAVDLELIEVVDRINMADSDGTSRLDSKGWVNNCDLRIATDREIELRLISDAKKKGLVLGSRVIVGGNECNISGYKYQKKSAMQKENGIILVDNNAYSYCIDDVTIAPVKKASQTTPPDKMYFEEGQMVLCIKYSSYLSCPYIGQVGEVVYVTKDIINVKFPGGMWGFDRKFIGDLEATSRRVDRMPELITVDFEVKYHHEDFQESIIIRQIDPSLLLLL